MVVFIYLLYLLYLKLKGKNVFESFNYSKFNDNSLNLVDNLTINNGLMKNSIKDKNSYLDVDLRTGSDFLSYNKFLPECCLYNQEYSTGNGCPCVTPEQQAYLNSNGLNKTGNTFNNNPEKNIFFSPEKSFKEEIPFDNFITYPEKEKDTRTSEIINRFYSDKINQNSYEIDISNDFPDYKYNARSYLSNLFGTQTFNFSEIFNLNSHDNKNRENGSGGTGGAGGAGGAGGRNGLGGVSRLDLKKFAIHYKNSSNTDFKIILDNQPMCEKLSTVTTGDCPQEVDSSWMKSLGEFKIIRTNNDIDTIEKSNKINLKIGEILRIEPPVDSDGYPFWCFDQPCNPTSDISCINFDWKSLTGSADTGIKRNCPGVGSFVVRPESTMTHVKGTTRFEYNINDKQLWYNSSSVDGINLNNSMDYIKIPENIKNNDLSKFIFIRKTNDERISELNLNYNDFKACSNTGNSFKLCDISLTDPNPPTNFEYNYEATDYNTKRYPAIKEWFHGDATDINNDCSYTSLTDTLIYTDTNSTEYTAYGSGLTASNLAGCGYGDRANKIRCHLWWAENPCAKKWLNWLQGNRGDGTVCQQYGWAYDEMRYYPNVTTSFDNNGNPDENHSISPLHNCSIVKEYTFLEINIMFVL